MQRVGLLVTRPGVPYSPDVFKVIQMPATTAIAAGTYTLDTARSTIGLSHKTMWGMHRIRGIAMAVLKLDRIMTAPAGAGEMLASRAALAALLDYFVQTTHPGTIQLAGDTASGRAYIQELGRFRDGRSELNYAVYHDRCQRTGDGWKFTERVYDVRYLDTTPLAGSAPHAAPGRMRES